MIHLDEKRNVVEWPDAVTTELIIEESPCRGAACCARVPEARIGRRPITFDSFRPFGRSAAAPRGRSKQRPYRVFSIVAVVLAVGGVWALAERPGDWLLAVAEAPAFALDPDVAEAVAGAGWLAPSIQGGSFVDAIGAAIVAVTLLVLLALRVWQRFDVGSQRAAEEPAGVYKIVTNQTNADDRRAVAWRGWTSSPVCERVRSMVCG